jgi:hypothetical protein
MTAKKEQESLRKKKKIETASLQRSYGSFEVQTSAIEGVVLLWIDPLG